MTSINTDKLLDAIKSISMEQEEGPAQTQLDNQGAFLSNKELRPLVQQTGSGYTAQNNIQVSTLPSVKETFDIADTQYTFDNIVRKPYHILSFDVPSTAGAGSLVTSLDLPKNYFSANTVLEHIGNTFLSFRGKFHLLISAQGSPQYSGGLAAVVVYREGWNLVNTRDNYCNMLFRHHGILDFSDNSSTIDLVVPFRHSRTGCDPFDYLHSVKFHVMAPLAGSSSITVTVSAFIEDPVFRFLRPVDAPTRETQGLIDITTINQTMGDIANSTLPMHLEGDKLDLNPSMMDAVPIALNPSALIIKYNSLNNSDNPFPVDRMTMISGAERVSDETTFGTTEDEMDIRQLLQRDQYLDTFTITTTTAVNSCPFATYVCPSTLWSPERFNVISRIASYYKFWRGGLKYKFRFFMNRFQSIKLYAAMFYKDTNPTVLSDWSASHGVTLDIGGDQREVEVEVPYNAETSWLYLPYKNGQAFNEAYQKFILGKIALYTTTPLISPPGSPTSITCIVSVSVADDFEFAEYTPCVNATQGILLSERSKRKPGDICDCSPSLKTLFKRYHLMSNTTRTVNLKVARVMNNMIVPAGLHHDIVSLGPNLDNTVSNYLPDHYNLNLSHLWSGIRGGTTVRLDISYSFNDPETTLGIKLVPYCVYIPPTVKNTIDVSYMTALTESLNGMFGEVLPPDWATPYIAQPVNTVSTVSGAVATFELDCPYQSIDKFHLRRELPANGYILVGFYNPLKALFTTDTEVQFNVRAMAKLSDDGRLGLAELGSFPHTIINNWAAGL